MWYLTFAWLWTASNCLIFLSQSFRQIKQDARFLQEFPIKQTSHFTIWSIFYIFDRLTRFCACSDVNCTRQRTTTPLFIAYIKLYWLFYYPEHIDYFGGRRKKLVSKMTRQDTTKMHLVNMCSSERKCISYDFANYEYFSWLITNTEICKKWPMTFNCTVCALIFMLG